MAVIEAIDLRRTYRTTTGVLRRKPLEVEAVRGVSFAVEQGELFGLLGPNGAGKTTTIKMLITLLLPTSGQARVLGHDVVDDAKAVRKRIGYVFGGDRGLYERLRFVHLLGMLLGSIGLRAKDFFFAANLAYFLMLLFCGVNIPLSVLPDWMSAVGRCLPLTHGIAAAREVAAGASLGHVAGLVWTEAGVAVVYAAAGLLLFRILERESRRSAVLDVY
jgi:hypothetical protein